MDAVLRPGGFTKDLDTRLVYEGGHRNEELIRYRKEIFPLLLAKGGQKLAQEAIKKIKKEIGHYHENVRKSGLPEGEWGTLKDKEFGILYQELLEMIEPYLSSKNKETKRIFEQLGVFTAEGLLEEIQSFIVASKAVVSASTASGAAPKEVDCEWNIYDIL